MVARRSAPEGHLEAIRLWDDWPVDHRCVATRFTRDDGPSASGIALPAAIARAAPRRRAEWLAGRRCAGEALRLLTGHVSCPGMAPNRAPIWPQGILGSISHSGSSAIAIVARAGSCRGIGIDIERFLGEAEAGEIAAEAMTPAECRRLGAGDDPFLVTLAFCAKESLFKALYPLLRRPLSFHSSELVTWRRDGTALLRLREELSPEFPAGHEIALRYGTLHGLLLTRILILS